MENKDREKPSQWIWKLRWRDWEFLLLFILTHICTLEENVCTQLFKKIFFLLSIIYRIESIINLYRVEIRKHRHRSESLIPWTKSNIKSTQKT